MKIDILTLFPNMFDGFINESIIKRAINANKVTINIHNIRDYSKDPHKKVDDYAFGGGAGMVLMPQPIFDAVDTVKLCLPVFCDMIATMKVNKDTMLKGAKGGFTNATDLADYLVKKGLPFREAHGVVGRMVFYAIEHKKDLDDFTMNEMKEFSDIIEDDIYDAISMETCVNDRNLIGGPAMETTKKAISDAKEYIKNI